MAHLHSADNIRKESVSSSSTNRTYYNKTFEDTTDLFLFACAHGDYMCVHRLLIDDEVEADVSNKMGKSALQLAIENEHFEVVKVLLDKIPYEKFRDALLLAIYLGHTNIADFIMNHPTYRTFSGGFLDPTHPQAYDDSQFSSDITPLILAAQYNRLQIVHQLLSKGERIQKPHKSMCPCVDCADSSAYDSFRQAQVRLSAYKGLSSEVYIALTYPDPILQAFELNHEIRTLAKVEHYFREDYEKLSHQLSIFVTRLLDNVRGHEELEIVLNKTGQPHEEKYENLARFDLAIINQEKAFVSHSNCQQKLMEKWYENLSAIKNAHLTKRILFYLAFIVCLPFLLLAYYFFPQTKIGSLCHQPNLKLKAYIVSYLTFISLIVASSYFSISHLQKTKFLSNYNSTIYKFYIENIYENDQLRYDLNSLNQNSQANKNDRLISCDISLRFMEPNPFQIAIFIWVIGFVWQEIKQLFGAGVRVYLKSHSNYVDCLMNILYILYFICLYSSMVLTRTSMNMFHSSDYWRNIVRYDNMRESEKVEYLGKTYHILYWLNADRYYWSSNDLQNLAEAFFAMGNVASICRICFLLPIIGFVGPLQVMLERMIIDISKWIVIILIFFVAFACSLFLIFSPFATALKQHDILHSSSNTAASQIVSLMRYETLSMSTSARCLPYYKLINQSFPNVTALDAPDVANLDENNSCKQSKQYDKIENVGPHPAIHYFGEKFGSTILTTFFTLFGDMAEDDIPDRGYELISLTCNKPDPKSYAPGFDIFSSNLGFIIFGLFTFICVTVLINTLIAMMGKTIDIIDNRADVEWKFARSRLYMEYVRDGNSLPVPMNICPTPKSFIHLFKRIKNLILSKNSSDDDDERANETGDDRLDGLNIRRRNHDDDNDNDINIKGTQHDRFKHEKIFDRQRSYAIHEKLTYKIVIERIIRRFLIHYKNKHTGANENNDGLEFKEFKNDVSSLRFELLNEVDMLDDMRLLIGEPMNKFNDILEMNFDMDKIKEYLHDQKLI